MKLFRNYIAQNQTNDRIKAFYNSPKAHNEIIATRDKYMFQRDSSMSILDRNGFICGYLPSVDREYPKLEGHLKDVIQANEVGVEAIFSKVTTSKSKTITENSSTRYMARLGTLDDPLEGSIPLRREYIISIYKC